MRELGTGKWRQKWVVLNLKIYNLFDTKSFSFFEMLHKQKWGSEVLGGLQANLNFE